MLPDKVKVSFTIHPKLLLVSPLVVLALFASLYLPWGAESAPAWVQAVGSIAAIFAAWMIPLFHENARREKSKSDVYDSAGWLALRIRNQLRTVERMLARVEEEADPAAFIENWRGAGGIADAYTNKQAADELPISAFCGSDISLLIAIRAVAAFACDCSERLYTWDFEAEPDIATHFPLIRRLPSYQRWIEWAMTHTYSRPGSGFKPRGAGSE